jgi:RNase P protein component
LKHEPKAEAVIAKLQSKVAVQRNEIARLTQLVERLMAQRDSLTKDLKWMRGEK